MTCCVYSELTSTFPKPPTHPAPKSPGPLPNPCIRPNPWSACIIPPISQNGKLVALLSEVTAAVELVFEVVVEFVSVARAVITKPPMIAARAVKDNRVNAAIFLFIFLHLLFI